MSWFNQPPNFPIFDGFFGIRGSAGQALDVVATSGQSRAPWYFHLFGVGTQLGYSSGIFLLVQIEILFGWHKKLRVLLLENFRTFKVMVISTGFGLGLFLVNGFFGSPGFVGCMCWWLQSIATMVLSEAEFCTGIVQKKHNPRFVSRFSWCFFTLLLNLVFLGKNVSFPQNAKNWAVVKHRRPAFICAIHHDVTWDRSSCDNSINRPENHQNYQPTDR